MRYYKRIVFDLDDTISKTTNRDFENAEPNLLIIEKINKLYHSGWEVIIMTARGFISCEGDRERAKQKYQTQIENWLAKYGVKYHQLSFNKILAAYYVDDKSLTPEGFLQLEIEDLTKKEGSGAAVERRGNKVYKNSKNSLSEASWYQKIRGLVYTPEVYSVVGETICLQYIQSKDFLFLRKEELFQIINSFKSIPSEISFSSYIERMKNHCEANKDFFKVLDALRLKEDYYNERRSFCHGDFSVDNLIREIKEGQLYLIDPIYNPDSYSSYLLDISKLLYSFERDDNMSHYHYFKKCFIKEYQIEERYLHLLELTQWIRVIKYLKNFELKSKFKEIVRLKMKMIC